MYGASGTLQRLFLSQQPTTAGPLLLDRREGDEEICSGYAVVGEVEGDDGEHNQARRHAAPPVPRVSAARLPPLLLAAPCTRHAATLRLPRRYCCLLHGRVAARCTRTVVSERQFPAPALPYFLVPTSSSISVLRGTCPGPTQRRRRKVIHEDNSASLWLPRAWCGGRSSSSRVHPCLCDPAASTRILMRGWWWW